MPGFNRTILCSSVTVGLAAACSTGAADGATFQVIYSATSKHVNFESPVAPASNGQLYVTNAGVYGKPSTASVVLLTPPQEMTGPWLGSTVFNFAQVSPTPYNYPYTLSISPKGLVGAAYGGGPDGLGGAFLVSKSTTPLMTQIHDFADGQAYGPLASGNNSLFYGLSIKHVYALNLALPIPSYIDLANLRSAPVKGTTLAVGSAGQLYGALQSGSAVSYLFGVIFQLSSPADGGHLQALYNLGATASDFYNPAGSPITDAQGNVYGCASNGPTGNGGVFELTPPATAGAGWTETVVYAFPSAIGEPLVNANYGSSNLASPCYLAIDPSSGKLFGTTFLGGLEGYGSFFELDPPVAGQSTWTGAVLHSFTGGTDDGAYPQPPVKIGNAYFGASLATTRDSEGNNTALIWSITP